VYGYTHAWMDAGAPPHNPVLHYLAVVRAARDFGLSPDQLEPLTRGFRPAVDSVDELAETVAAVVLEHRA
jgi:hypothetical protein